MHLISLVISILVSAIVARTSQSLEPTLNLEVIFMSKTTLGSALNTTSPFGTRMHAPLTGGNLTDPKTGEVVATLLQTTDNGIFSDSGIFFPSAVLPYVWTVDGHLASMTVHGVGALNGLTYNYVHVETDSPTYSWMNSNFFVFKAMVTMDPPEITSALYGVTNTTS
ncbi:hypothetical protein BD309DRAFT_948814 [Dichomitus squalens]|uniref:Uncharacterized protein n=2 Tax=Dichomitus squalens TaxID=114155 RepID=A0A4Q9PTJ8_9APHY|nr:uncharacterized protein DICSQDRAFT_171513 [Dichomitus squalens LYAD-421 SS1]EJF60025.1 hypothetical protein DICSQDRAFT_171513 [Dichomitus squalens LYAD-421 SS1]TBU29189.1 hypothetical protein BD311DRAFT_788026 [Dichomitus squalens]TBU48770.1 hypothetical protein BD309DRAFT_948814 [Dichomitus squalens]TBU57822.1 hypothetical protein BD310DRAFT_513948 [Dichomitus squalens]